MAKLRIACHLIQWAGEEEQNLEKVLGEVADAGYEGVEAVAIKSSGELVEKAALAAKLGLHLVNSHGSDSPIERVKINIALGNNASEVPALARNNYGGNNPTAEDMARASKDLDEVLSFCQAHNVKGFHHAHIGTAIESLEDAERVLKAIPKLWLLFDTGHLQAAGSDPLKVLKVLGNRIGHVHLKDFYADDPKTWKWDYKTSRFGETARFCELGRGNGPMKDIKKVLKELEALGYDGWISVELDRPYFAKSAAEAAKVNRNFLKSLGY